MSTGTQLLQGLAQIIDTAGLGVYDPDRIWTETDVEVGIVLGGVPETPSSLISLDSYSVSDDPRENDSVLAVQAHVRGTADPASVRDLTDALFNLLQGLHDVVIGGVPVVILWRQSSVPQGQDENQRWARSSNYYARIGLPTIYRT